MYSTNMQDRKPIKSIRFRFFLSAFMVLMVLCVGGCGKNSAATATNMTELSTPNVPVTVASETLTTTEQHTTALIETTTVPETTTETPEISIEPTTPVQETTTPLEASREFVRRRGGESGGEIISMLPLPEIPYVRPDYEGILDDLDLLAVEAKTSSDARAIIETYKSILDRKTKAHSMSSLASFRYYQDTTDSYYKSEVEYLNAQETIMENKERNLIRALADSPLRNKLESAYFGRGYFDFYAKSAYQNEAYLVLADREMELANQFDALTMAPEIAYQGEIKLLNEWLASESNEERDGAQASYILSYHDSLGPLFLELVEIRHQIAEQLGYENYISYAFKELYYRDYSPERAGEFLEKVRIHLVPLLQALYEKNPDLHHLNLPSSMLEDPLGHLAAASEGMGGIIHEANRFMTAYKLCDADASPGKGMSAGTAYLKEYEAPMILVNTAMFNDGLITIAHEFGHFVQAYYTYGRSVYYEIAEVFSHAMEYLALAYDPLIDQEDRNTCLRTVLALQLLNNLCKMCAYADFELQVYGRDSAELTLEELDELYYQCRKNYGLQDRYPQEAERGSWVVGSHFYTAPISALSYPIAEIVGLQIIRLEAENHGAGLEAFCRLMERLSWGGIDALIRNAKLQSPLATETIEKTAAFLKEALELP